MSRGLKVTLLAGLIAPTAALASAQDFSAAALKDDGIRAGTTVSGTTYDFTVDSADFYDSADGNALDDKHWSVSCKRDAMSDVRICEAYHDSADLYIRASGSAKSSGLCVFHHDFPGRVAQLRIGTAKPLSSESSCFSHAISAALLTRMKPGVEVRTRYWKFPDDFAIDVDYRVTPAFTDMQAWINFWYAGGPQKLNWTTTPSDK